MYADYREFQGVIEAMCVSDGLEMHDAETQDQMDELLVSMSGIAPIITFGRPFHPLKDRFPEELLANYEIKKRWKDLKLIIEHVCGETPTLGTLAEGTLGFSKSEIPRLSRSSEALPPDEAIGFLHQRIAILAQLCDLISNGEPLVFYHNGMLLTAEVSPNAFMVDP